jgi:hypothetical protein
MYVITWHDSDDMLLKICFSISPATGARRVKKVEFGSKVENPGLSYENLSFPDYTRQEQNIYITSTLLLLKNK